MLTLFHLPPEVRNVIYQLTLQGSRLQLHSKGLQTPSEPPNRTALLQVSRQCHTEALSILCSVVELDITCLIGTPSWPSSEISFPLDKLRHLVLDGRKRDFGGGAVITLFPKLSSLTLLCGVQYRLPYCVSPDFPASAALVIEPIRASPWRVLGTKFWRPRTDLKGFIEIWKEKKRNFTLKTEMDIVVGDFAELWTGRFDLGTKTMSIWKTGGDLSSDSHDFPLEMLEP